MKSRVRAEGIGFVLFVILGFIKLKFPNFPCDQTIWWSVALVFVLALLWELCFVSPYRHAQSLIEEHRNDVEEFKKEIKQLGVDNEALRVKLEEALSESERYALLIKIRDLVFSAPKQPFEERVDVIGALIRFSDEFKNEKHVVWTCDELEQRQFENPFKILESCAPGIFDGRRLEFLREARTGMIDVRRNTSALSYAAKYWTHADEYTAAHRKFVGFTENEPEPEPEPEPELMPLPAPQPEPLFAAKPVLAPPKQIDKARVGFLQLDRIDYHREKAFVTGERFEMTAWFTNRGKFPVYKAQVFALLCYVDKVYPAVDDDMCRELKKAILAQWEKGKESQVAVGGSIYFPTAVKAMSQEQIDRVMSGEGRIYLATRARWSNDAGEEVTPTWEACSYLEAPASTDANAMTLKWRIVS